MIRLQRPAEPRWWSEHRRTNEPRWRLQFESKRFDRRPDTGLIWGDRQREIGGILLAAQRGKCVFCESALTFSKLYAVAHFRPHSNAIIQEETTPRHYYWLAFEWSNLLVLCVECHRLRGNRWPINGDLAAVGMSGAELDREQPLVIDPYRDDPSKHFVADDSGRLIGMTGAGQTTIEVFSLNRVSLVTERRRAWEDSVRAFEVWKSQSFSQSASEYEYLANKNAPFLFARRTALLSQGREPSPARRLPIFDGERGSLRYPDLPVSPVEPLVAPSKDVSIRGSKFRATLWITRIEIEYFLRLNNVTVNLGEDFSLARLGSGNPAMEEASQYSLPAMVFLGENACGKTSILKACALTLTQQRVTRSDGYLPDDINESSVTIELSDGTLRRLILQRGRRPRHEGPPLDLPIFAFGASAPTRQKRGPRRQLGDPHVKELLAEPVRTPNVETWLSALPEGNDGGPGYADDVKQAIRKLIDRGDDVEFSRDAENKLGIILDGRHTSLSDLSAGYQWFIGIAAELMAQFERRSMDNINGNAIVFIDEFGAHLHPRWKMVAMRRLRETFPQVQFIVSTHDPLCLHGIRRGEVTLLQRDEEGNIEAIQDLPSPEGLRADQLLCSEFFGLSSTIDEQIQAELDEYRDLSKISNRSDDQERRMANLAANLQQVEMLGSNEREAMMLEVIDMYLVRRRLMRGVDISARQRLRLQAYRDLWKIVAES